MSNKQPGEIEWADDISELLADAAKPTYYRGYTGGAQPIDIAEHLSFNRGAIVKYVARAGKKPGADELDDLLKARQHLNREIDLVIETQGETK